MQISFIFSSKLKNDFSWIILISHTSVTYLDGVGRGYALQQQIKSKWKTSNKSKTKYHKTDLIWIYTLALPMLCA